MLNDIKQLKKILKSKNEPYIGVDFDFYIRWKYAIQLMVYFNKNYLSCSIFRRKYKMHHNLVVVGLKTSGKNVKRRTTGYAKEFLQEKKNPKCIYCKSKLNEKNASTDHIVPISDGGTNVQVNLVVVCDRCNGERGNLDFLTYYKKKNPKFKNKKYVFI